MAARIERAASAVSIVVPMILSISISLTPRRRSNSNNESRLDDGSGMRRSSTDRNNTSSRFSFSVACSSQRCRASPPIGEGEQGPQASTAFFHSEATVRNNDSRSPRRRDFGLELKIRGRTRARFEHVSFHAVARTVDIDNVVVSRAEQPRGFVCFLVIVLDIHLIRVRGSAVDAEQVQCRHLPILVGVGLQQFEELADQGLPLVGPDVGGVGRSPDWQTSLNQRFARP